VHHYGASIKNVVNDLKGDGIISAIDIYVDAKIIKGSHGEDRGTACSNVALLQQYAYL